jgi:hypothetical protein
VVAAGTAVNNTGRNDFVTMKVAHDSENVYFYCETKDPITPRTDPNWMLLFIDADAKSSTGWEGYDYRVNASVASDTTTTLERFSGSNWTKAADVAYRVAGNKMELKIKRADLGLDKSTTFALDFHWADNIQKQGDILEFSLNGDSAPNRRFNYHYAGANRSASRTGVRDRPSSSAMRCSTSRWPGGYRDSTMAARTSAYACAAPAEEVVAVTRSPPRSATRRARTRPIPTARATPRRCARRAAGRDDGSPPASR